MELRIVYLPVGDLKPYRKNARRHTVEDVEAIVSSIKRFGFDDPIGIWSEDNVVVEGHGRLLAAKKLGMERVPCVRLDHLSDEERRAYALAHNRTAELSEWDEEFLKLELDDLPDMDIFNFDWLDEEEEKDDTPSSLQHNVFENQERMQFEEVGFYGIPAMQGTQTSGERLLRFCDYGDVEDLSEYICHFYYDDYKFIAAWRDPDKYIPLLRKFKAVISPDFSLYTDFPRALQILSCYRRQWCGAYWQSLGLDVIPDVVWGDEKSYAFCFDGIPKRSVVAVSSVGVSNDKEWNGREGERFRNGYNEMLKRLEPTKIIFYGTILDGLEGDIIRVPSFYEERRKILNNRRSHV